MIRFSSTAQVDAIGLDDESDAAGVVLEPSDVRDERWCNLARFTTEVPIRLLTPRSAQRALEILGFDWSPQHRDQAVAVANMVEEPGLYAWLPRMATHDPLDRGVLYWGIGSGLNGVDGRLNYEYSAARPEYDHGHGLAVGRLGATVVRGPVRTALQPAEVQRRAAQFAQVGLNDRGHRQVEAFLSRAVTSGPRGPVVNLALVEWFLIRLSIQVGQTGAPVQSQHATAWANTSTADWMAYAVRRKWETTAD